MEIIDGTAETESVSLLASQAPSPPPLPPHSPRQEQLPKNETNCCQLRWKWNPAKQPSGNWRSGAFEPNLSVVSKAVVNASVTILTTLLRSAPCNPAIVQLKLSLADRIRYNDNADDARNELQLLRLECATILEQLPPCSQLAAPTLCLCLCLDWLHLSGQWDLYLYRAAVQSGLCAWCCSALPCSVLILRGSFTVFKFVSICAIISWFRFAYATLSRPRPSTNWPTGQLLRYNCHRSQRNSQPLYATLSGSLHFSVDSLECQQISLTAIC